MKSEASGKPDVAGLVSQARDKLAEVDSAYSTMEYGKAIQPALEAHSLAKQASPGFVAPQDAARYLEDI